MTGKVREASHAGSWYDDDPVALGTELDQYMKQAGQVPAEPISTRIRAIIAPHAGYTYSGPTAGYAYRCMNASSIERIYILGPLHHVYLNGCALTLCSTFSTPLGPLRVDRGLTEELHETGEFEWMAHDADEDEHSIEMHLPYVKKCIGNRDIPIIPIYVGQIDLSGEQQFGKVLAPYLFHPNAFTIVSSDFCHWGARFGFTPRSATIPIHKHIENLDREGMDLIAALDTVGFHRYQRRTRNTICGRHPIAVLLHAIKEDDDGARLWKAAFVRYAQSHRVTSPTGSSTDHACVARSLFLAVMWPPSLGRSQPWFTGHNYHRINRRPSAETSRAS